MEEENLGRNWANFMTKFFVSKCWLLLYVFIIRGATQNFREFEYAAQTISATNLRR